MNITRGPLSGKTRTERDLLGEKKIPVEYYFGVQTMRAMENFNISKARLNHYPELIKGLADVKESAAMANAELGLMDAKVAKAIVKACQEVRAGKFNDHFVVDMFQGGAGTSTNMNANEVIANRALEILGHERGEYKYCHPNNHINLSQSTNDAYPTAMKIALIRSMDRVEKSLELLVASFAKKGKEFAPVLKMGRTQLQDAVPMTLGQEFEAYSVTLKSEIERLKQSTSQLFEVNMGATAIGTGINSDPDYTAICVRHMAKITGLKIKATANMIEATSDMGGFISLSSAHKRLFIKVSKICNDLRLLASGPRAGFNELNLPPMQPGSTIMPGKVNPVIPEVVNQVAFRVFGNDTTVSFAAEAGQLQLNVMEPAIVFCLLENIDMMIQAMDTLRTKCVDGITANKEVCQAMVDNSIGLVTALNPYLDYGDLNMIAAEALKTGEGVYDLVLKHKLLSKKNLDMILKPANMIKPTKVSKLE